ncbi:putative spore germination protein GerPC [Neobacillus rhizosphaerae]|uniref:Spore germination protein GerPC n=1 Tax=Neobacillus rhizosphaerae TaxID=2880965 RepID=A0ABN8KM34_9BACI|nr:spore germination protein GerPC [Neobacillus rhizosphaerae]CAH2713526.1 putative spore germination protein GerPC [Neobacillus rhizosphaerae]
MYQDVYQYLQGMQMYIQAQEKRIVSLETTVQKMKEEIQQLNEKKLIHVDKIEYKFDQLKVETLEGTLNIGLNPSDLSEIEDFAVQNQTLTSPFSPKAQMQRSMKIEEAIYRYLETDLPQIIVDTQKKFNMEPSDSYLAFIKEDIIKQLPNRIEFHLKASKAQNRSIENGSDADIQIIEVLKQEIQNGVFVFINQLPENVKGMKPE